MSSYNSKSLILLFGLLYSGDWCSICEHWKQKLWENNPLHGHDWNPTQGRGRMEVQDSQLKPKTSTELQARPLNVHHSDNSAANFHLHCNTESRFYYFSYKFLPTFSASALILPPS